MRVLVVEDDASALALVAEELGTVADGGIVVAETLDDACRAVHDGPIDCAVLDLSLPDGWGLDTLLTFRRRVPAVPVVVVSGSQGIAFEGKARRAGADGFLVKGTMVAGDVATAVVDAVAASRAGRAAIDPIAELSDVAQQRSPVSAMLFGQQDLRDALEGRFDLLVERYSDLLEMAMERTAFAGEYGLSEHLRDMATTMGLYGAGPRDVVQLHARALELQQDDRQGAGAPEFVHESRLVVLELMGYLASYYRAQALGRGADPDEDG